MKLAPFFASLTYSILALIPASADELEVLRPAFGGVSNAAAAQAPAAALEAWLHAEFIRSTERRASAFETMLKSRSAGAAWQAERRRFFLQRIGGLPERTPLNPQIVGTLEGKGYRVEKIILETRPKFHLTANLYLPQSPGPWPAVLVPCGHSHEGKAVGQYQRACILLARHGMAAICYDPIGQGERYQMLDSIHEHKAFVDAAHIATPHPMVRHLCTTEHTMIGLGSALVGSNVAQFRIWDGMRVIDYLQSRSDIRGDRIGCAGNSGGGTETAYLMALDRRIVAAAPGCSLTTFRKLIETKGPQDGEQNIFGQISFGMDQADFCILAAPRPVLICAGVRDATFDFRGTWELFLEAKRFYSRMGYPERIDLNAPDAPHGFTLPQRQATARWMHRWLLGTEKDIREIDDLPDQLTDDELRAYNEPDWTPAELQCTPRGQVLLLPGERSTFEINAATAARLRTERAATWAGLDAAGRRRLIRSTIGSEIVGPVEMPQAEILGTIQRDGYSIRKLAIAVEGGVRLPALAFVPEKPTGPMTLYLHGSSIAADAGPDGPIAALVRKGHVVLAAELRGIGETETGHGKKEFGKGRFGPDNLEIFVAYLTGRSFVGLRTDDALRWTAYLREGELAGRKPTELHLTAIGEAAIPALHAAALADGAFRTVTVRQMIKSWESVVAAPETFNQSVNVVHGVLRHYDLADLSSLIGADRLSVSEFLDPMGHLLEKAEAAEFEVTAAPMVVVRRRPGITGAGWLAVIQAKAPQHASLLRLVYPNHADDWGKSTGTGASLSRDGGLTWSDEPDDTPLAGMVDQWIQQFADGSLLAIGVRSVPYPKSRTAQLSDGRSAWMLGRSTDLGASWTSTDCRIDCPAELGVIARPLPPILENSDGNLYMPAYSWSAAGSRALLLESQDRGAGWSVKSVIADAAAIRAAGVPVTTPWLETTIARTLDGGWLAVVRTGSSAQSALIQTRSADGRTWDSPAPLLAGAEQQPVGGKLPSLLRLPGGVLALLTAHTQNHCRIYISADGAGQKWSEGYVVTSQSGGNTSAAVVDDSLVVITPANERLHAWRIDVKSSPRRPAAQSTQPPKNPLVTPGPNVRLRWEAPSDGTNIVGYRVSPQLIAAANPATQPLRYASVETAGPSRELDLARVVSIGGRYRFAVQAIDSDGRLSPAAMTDEIVVGLSPAAKSP